MPLTDSGFVQTALIPLLEPFLLWPQPCAQVARQVLEMLRAELLAPGSAVRARARAETRLLAVRNAQGERYDFIFSFSHP